VFLRMDSGFSNRISRRIITETGLRVYKELMPMKKEQLDLANAMVWIPDSKTPNGVIIAADREMLRGPKELTAPRPLLAVRICFPAMRTRADINEL
jgi:integrase